MTDDHYVTLGVLPATEDVVIRAAYLALMRRYHPDRNSSPAAIERAQSVIAAFAVVGDPELRMKYDWDRRRAAEAAAGFPPRRLPFTPRGMAITLIALLSLVTFVALRAHLARGDPPAPIVAQRADPALAKLVPAAATSAQDCVSPFAQAAIKRQLLRRAASIGGDQQGFAQRIAASTLRVGQPSFARQDPIRDSVECSAAVTLALPAGLAFAGGQRAVVAELDYSLRPRAAAGDPPIVITNGDIIAARLALLAPPLPSPIKDQPLRELAEVEMPAPVAAAAPRPAARIVRPTPAALPRPEPRKIAEPRKVAVAEPKAAVQPKLVPPTVAASAPAKKNDNIVALERNTAAFYNQSYTYGKGAKRTALLSSRNSYLARREACRSDACLRGVHLSHMREIAAVMQSGPSKPAP